MGSRRRRWRSAGPWYEVAQGINGYIAELERIGCVLKGFDDGLVDFRSTIDGRDVWLCWKLGEPEVAHWHALDQGYQSRQPLDPQQISRR